MRSNYNSFLMTDFYKATHLLQFRPEITHFTSYLTPRGSRFESIDKMVFFGLTEFISKYIVDNFENNFFARSFASIALEIDEVLSKGLGYSQERIEKTLVKIKELHDLKYLPIEICGVPEGTRVPMGVPAIEIRTTKPETAWVGQALESLLSCSIWHPCVSATIAYEYGKIARKAYEQTADVDWRTAMCDFSMRGQESYESAVASAAAWLTTFYNSSTVDARRYIEYAYKNCGTKPIGGLTSTEHSVMTSDFAIAGDERETYRRLLTEIYPDVSFCAVCDSYDFWRVVTEILPSLKKEIDVHEGFLGIRHDSSEPVYALCGLEVLDLNKMCGIPEHLGEFYECSDFGIEDLIKDIYEEADGYKVDKNKTYLVECQIAEPDGYGSYDYFSYCKVVDFSTLTTRDPEPADYGMVEMLYKLFGGTTNSKGYIVVNPKVKAVYGDSITIPRAKEIYRRLEAKGFAANNVSLGVGSFSMECLEENGELKPFTRDSFSIAIKATYGKRIDENGNIVEFPIYKDPKGFSQKKSLKGLCVVYEENGELKVQQELNEDEYNRLNAEKSIYDVYYINGTNCAKRKSFDEVRNRIYKQIEEENL